MLAVEVAALAAQVLDACEERMIGVADQGIAYDHAATEARLVVAGCLDVAGDALADAADVRGARVILESALWLLSQLPVPTYRHAFHQSLRKELSERGFHVPPWLRLVA